MLAALAIAGPLLMAAVPASAARASLGPAVPPGPVIFVGVGGLRWSDITPATPHLWQVVQRSAVASMSVRTREATTCPLDGWLTLNSGTRSGGPRDGDDCAPPPVPTRGGGSDAVPGWSRLIADNTDSPLPVWGTLRDRLIGRSGACALGPGAAVALADPRGDLGVDYAATADALPPRCDLLVADAGALPDHGPERASALQTADALVDVLAGRGQTLVIAGISDGLAGPAGGDVVPHLAALAIHPPDGYDPAHRPWLRSPSTRQTGLVQLSDLTPTLASGTDRSAAGNALVLRSGPARTGDLLAADTAAQTLRQIFVPFFTVFIAGQVLALALVVLGFWRGRIGRPAAARAVRVIAVWFAAVAPATFAANLLPWERSGHPAVALWTATGLGATAAAAVALAGPWRRHPYGPPAFIGGLTAVGLAADVATGSHDQINAIFGLSMLVAGRFYGFGNITFSVFAVCALTAAAAVGTRLLAAGRRRWAALAAGSVAAVAAVVDGWPGLGTDFGGVISLLPGAAVLALGVGGIRWRPKVVAVVGLGTAVAVTGLAVRDWRRPAARRSHVGRFVQDVLDGHGARVLHEKAAANLGLLRDAPVIVAVFVPLVALAALVVWRPGALRLSGLVRVRAADPAFRSLLAAALVTGLLGFAANDSGVILPAVALITGAPLFTAIWASLWAQLPAGGGAEAAELRPAGATAPG